MAKRRGSDTEKRQKQKSEPRRKGWVAEWREWKEAQGVEASEPTGAKNKNKLPDPVRLKHKKKADQRLKDFAKSLEALGVSKDILAASLKQQKQKPPIDRVMQRSEALRMRETLEWAAEKLGERRPGLKLQVAVNKNKSGSVTGQLRITNLPKNLRAEAILNMAEQAMGAVPEGHWVSVGTRFHMPADVKAEYARKGETASVASYYQPERPQVAFLTTREIIKRMRKRGRDRPEELLVRLQWNGANEQPERRF